MRIRSFTKLVFMLTLLITLNGLLGWVINQPQDVGADVPEGKLKSLSFAPYRTGQSPLLEIFPTPEQIEADLKLMGQNTLNIRTYASAEGNMPVIPELAGKYGLTVLQGAWLSPVAADNKKEINELIRCANAHPDTVKRVIVGNEVLLRKDLPVDQLIEYIREVKKSVKQPVSYADVWSEYMKHPQLIKEVDFITIHILPYWEDRPIPVDEAPEHIKRIVETVKREAQTISPDKPILIGESGWPSLGKQRGDAIPSVVNEAHFIRALIKVANDNGFDYNIVEAFNQPWKSAFEGVVGANWGLYDAHRNEVFPLAGKVYENAKWSKGFIASSIILIIVSLRFRKALRRFSLPKLSTFLALLLLLSLLLVNQTELLWQTSYSSGQRIATAIMVSLNILLGGLFLRRSHALLANQETSAKLSKNLYDLYSLVCLFAIYKTLQLAIDGRYISFPTPVTNIAVFGLLGLVLVHTLSSLKWSRQAMQLHHLLGDIGYSPFRNKLIGNVLLLSGLALIFGETYAFMVSRDLIAEQPEFTNRLLVSTQFTFGNGQLIVWLASITVLAMPLLCEKKQ